LRNTFLLKITPKPKDVKKYKYVTDGTQIGQGFNNITIISGDSTDQLTSNWPCRKGCRFGSTVGVEASYWNKPVLLAGAMYINLDVAYYPSSLKIWSSLILRRLELQVVR
jgi:hypothetical protein